MEQNDYIKQLEEANQKLQERLEESEIKFSDLFNAKVYIYLGDSKFPSNISLEDLDGYFINQSRIVSTIENIRNKIGYLSSQIWDGGKWLDVPTISQYDLTFSVGKIPIKQSIGRAKRSKPNKKGRAKSKKI